MPDLDDQSKIKMYKIRTQDADIYTDWHKKFLKTNEWCQWTNTVSVLVYLRTNNILICRIQNEGK